MPLVVTPEVGIPFPFDTTPEEIEDFREKAHAMFRTIEELASHGADVEVTPEDKAESHRIMAAGKMPSVRDMRSGTIINLEAILTEWDEEVLDVSRRLRNYVTNKLIMESVDPDPKQRIKALELLGKTANVGLFAERIDVNVTYRTVNDIEAELRRTLELYGAKPDIEDVEIIDNSKNLASLDLDEELGLSDGPESIS
jgi:hypothetical protein